MGSAHDYDRSLWSSRTDVNHARAQQAGLTAELVTVLSSPFSASGCFLVESAIRQGYNVTLLTTPTYDEDTGKRAYSHHEKERLTTLYGRLQRQRILQEELGIVPKSSRLDLDKYTRDDLLALPHPVKGSKTDQALVEYLVKHPHLYLFTDAFDVLVQLSPIELHKRLRATWPSRGDREEYFIISTEANQAPSFHAAEWYPDSNRYMFPFVNSGMWIARLDRMIRFTEHIYNSSFVECTGNWSFSDQCKMMVAISDPIRRFTEFPTFRDVNATILQSMMPAKLRRGAHGLDSLFDGEAIFHPASHLGMTPEGLLTRRDISNTPVALHWNGPAKTFNTMGQPITPDVASVDMSVYRSLGWMRRPITPGGEQPVYFHLSRADVEAYLSVYNEQLQLDTTLREQLFTLCTAKLGSTLRKFESVLKQTQLGEFPSETPN